MIIRLLRRHNRALTLVSAVALCLFLLLPNADVARGALIGGLLAVLYLGLLEEQLAGGLQSEPGRVRGRLFATLLMRLGLLAVGLGVALSLSRTVFWSAVVALGAMYGLLVLGMSRRLWRAKAASGAALPDEADEDYSEPDLECGDEGDK